MNQILDLKQPSLIELELDSAELKLANGYELFKRFLEPASQLVTNENIVVRAEVRGISKLASRFPRNSNDPFSIVIEGDQLIIFNGKISNFSRFFQMSPSIVITSQPNQVQGRRVAIDFYGLSKTPIVLADNENVLAEALMAAAIALTQKTHEALMTFDQETYRLTAPGALEFMLNVLSQKIRQRLKLAIAA